MAKKRISASIDTKIIAYVDTLRIVEKRSFSSMIEILILDSLKSRKIKI